MSKKAQKTYEEIQDFLSRLTKGLSTADYQDVLENVHCDIEGMLESLEPENEE